MQASEKGHWDQGSATVMQKVTVSCAQRTDVRWMLRRTVASTAIAGLVVLTWLVKNWLVVGNPVSLFLFGGVDWDATREAWMYWIGQSYSHDILDYLTLPWLMKVLGIGGKAYFGATISPLILCLAPLVLLLQSRARTMNCGLMLTALRLGLFAVMLWRYLFFAQSRLLLAAFPLLCLAAAYAFDKLPHWDQNRFHLSWIVYAIVTLLLIVTFLTQVHAFMAARPWSPLVGLEVRGDCLTRRIGYHFAAMGHITECLLSESRVLYLWQPRGYYGQSQALVDTAFHNFSQLRLRYGDAEKVLTALLADGVTQFLLRRSGMQFLQADTARAPTLGSLLGALKPKRQLYPLTDADLIFLRALTAQCESLVDFGGAFEVYRLP